MNKFVKAFLIYFCILPVLTNSGKVLADAIREKEKVVLQVAIGNKGYFPFIQINNDEITGFTKDIFDYIAANSKYDFEYIQVPWPRALLLVEKGQLDLIPMFFKTSEREQRYHFIHPSYANEVIQLFSLKSSKIEFDGNLQQLEPYSIGIRREYSYGKAFDKASNLQKLPAVSEEVLLKLLQKGLVDLIISNPMVFNKLITNLNVSEKIKAIKPYISKTPVFVALTKKRADSLEIKMALENIIKQLISTPYYQTLLNKYQINY